MLKSDYNNLITQLDHNEIYPVFVELDKSGNIPEKYKLGLKKYKMLARNEAIMLLVP